MVSEQDTFQPTTKISGLPSPLLISWPHRLWFSAQWQFSQDTSLIIVTLTNIIMLKNTNYLSWNLQLAATLVNYYLSKFLDGTHDPHPTPSPTPRHMLPPLPTRRTPLGYAKTSRFSGAMIGTLTPLLYHFSLVLPSLRKHGKSLPILLLAIP